MGLNEDVSHTAYSTHPNTSVVLNMLEMKMYSNINDNRPAAEVFRLDIAAVVSPGMENTFFSKKIFSVFNYILIFFLILCSSAMDATVFACTAAEGTRLQVVAFRVSKDSHSFHFN